MESKLPEIPAEIPFSDYIAAHSVVRYITYEEAEPRLGDDGKLKISDSEPESTIFDSYECRFCTSGGEFAQKQEAEFIAHMRAHFDEGDE